MAKINVFKKNTKMGDVYFLQMSNCKQVSISAKLTNSFKDLVLEKGLSFPLQLVVDLSKGDYFTTTEDYVNKDGVQCIKDIVVIQNARSMEHLELPATSLEDLVKTKCEEKGIGYGILADDPDVPF